MIDNEFATTAVNPDAEIEAACVYDISIGCVFQNEARYLNEWIEFHKLIGVQHFVLINDRSTDDFLEVLQPYIDAREVELFSNPCPEALRGRNWPKYQCAVHSALVKHQRGVSRWLALVDVDEFIVPSLSNNLLDFLRDYEDFGGLYIRWEPFGTSYVAQVPERALMIETLCLKWKFIKGYDMLGKSIVKPQRVLRANIHECELMPGFSYLDSNPGMESEIPSIRIFHYWSRDEEFLLKCKLPRTLAIKDWGIEEQSLDYFKTLFNDVPDYSMRRFGEQLRARVSAHPHRGSKT